jgi:hypothetical protein
VNWSSGLVCQEGLLKLKHLDATFLKIIKTFVQPCRSREAFSVIQLHGSLILGNNVLGQFVLGWHESWLKVKTF